MIIHFVVDKAKSQLVSKANCQAVDSTKNQTNEFAFFYLKSCYVVKSNAFRCFFGESTARRFVYDFNLPLVRRKLFLEPTCII